MNALIRYDEACKALAKAKSVDEAKSIKNKAEALRAFARIAQNRELEIDAAEIRIRAERRLGELIQQQKETVGLNPGSLRRGRQTRPREDKLTLAEVGVSKDLSSYAQKLAAIRDEEFEVGLQNWRDLMFKDGKRVTLSLFKGKSNGRHDVVEKEQEDEEDWIEPNAFKHDEDGFLIAQAFNPIFDLIRKWPESKSLAPIIGKTNKLLTILEKQERKRNGETSA